MGEKDALEQTEQKILRGTVVAVTFQNEENGYTVLKLRDESGDVVTVVGTIPMTRPGERLTITGTWGRHATYGPQFNAEFLERLMPESGAEIEAYLSTGIIKGIGARTAKKLVERYGDRTLDVLENHPEELAQMPGISQKKANEITTSFQRLVGVRRLIEFLSQYHLPPELAMRIFRVYGDLSVEAIRDDPYLLTGDFFGASFMVVDTFALEMGVEGDDERRVEAGILYELAHNTTNGHVFLPADKLEAATMSLLHLEEEIIRAGMGRLQEDGRMVLDQIKNLEVCYLPQYHEAETYVTERILAMADRELEPPLNLRTLVDEIEAENDIQYAANQRQAIATAAGRQLMILTGGPGTGKTTTVNGILALFDRLGLKTGLTAPTGRAAKRLSELSGREASTIHRLLDAQFDPESGGLAFFHDEDEPLKLNALVVDETSMVDLLLLDSLLRALPTDCRLILVGDPNQLPSVGAGNVFADLIGSGVVETVCLTEIFRQARESLIVMNAHAVHNGELPELTVKNKDFFFMKRLAPDRVVQTICDLCATRLPQNMGIPSSEIQVLSPTRKGDTGTVSLNQRLQAVLNPAAPQKRERAHGKYIFREGDRVMQIRNNYDILWTKTEGLGSGTGIFNGDIGQITAIDPLQETMTVVFDDDKQATYGFDMLSELEPAYAMTVHKSQGSEYRAVILSVAGGSPLLLTRSVFYTAITRARELLILVGDEQVVATMVSNDRQQRRYSGLKIRLRQGRQEA
jgi:exodeoxyribonuclease V alpha subunit